VIVTFAGVPVAIVPSSTFTTFKTSSFSFSIAVRYAFATTFCLKSSVISLLNRFAIIEAGALPGRNPGMRAILATSPTDAWCSASTSLGSSVTTRLLRVAETLFSWTFTAKNSGRFMLKNCPR
jgi:hypothetical protein